MEYYVNHKRYSLSYKSLKEKYINYCSVSDKEFLKSLPVALHLACVIGYLKELDIEQTLADEGIIHQLVHLMDGTLDQSDIHTVKEIRKLFKSTLKLA